MPYLRSKLDPWSQEPVNPFDGFWHTHDTPETFADQLGLDRVHAVEIAETYESGSPKTIVVTGMKDGAPATDTYNGTSFRGKFGLRSHYVTQVVGEFTTEDPPPEATCEGLAATIVGTPGDDLLIGTSGDDVIAGLEGDDEIIGGPGNDVLCGGDGRDLLDGGLGDDILSGGRNPDTVTYETAQGGVVVNLSSGTATGAGSDTLIKIHNVTGSPFADTITGNASRNTLIGSDGDDDLRGKRGDDSLWGGQGNDRINGGRGDDRVHGGSGFDQTSYVAATGGVVVNLLTGQSAGPDGVDSIAAVENIVGSSHDDELIGSARVNWMWGKAGDDVMRGLGRDDQLRGGGGNGTAYGGAGSDLCRAETENDCEL